MKYLRTVLAGVFVACLGAPLSASAVSGPALRADSILIEKQQHKLTLLDRGVPVKVYKVALGSHPVGAKAAEGDGRTPEGRYTIDSRNKVSGFHLALHISYPNHRDVERARQAGVSPGGAVMIHGIKNGLGWIGSLHTLKDWTKGCVAVTDEEIEEIWAAVPDGTPVEIRP